MTISILPYKSKTGEAEFSCISCGVLVYAPIAPVEPVCAVCEFTRDMPVDVRNEVRRLCGFTDQW